MEIQLHEGANGRIQRAGVSIQENWPFSKQVNRKKSETGELGLLWPSRGQVPSQGHLLF